jgi:hypothetical protein
MMTGLVIFLMVVLILLLVLMRMKLISVEFSKHTFSVHLHPKDKRISICFGRGGKGEPFTSADAIAVYREWYENNECVYCDILFSAFPSREFTAQLEKAKAQERLRIQRLQQGEPEESYW